jgi:hypothetical protein
MTWPLIVLLALVWRLPHSDHTRVGSIDFFGTGNLLPVHKDDEIAENQSANIRDRLSRAIQNALGHKPGRIQTMPMLTRCCSAGLPA